jgi:hypothetical protein
LLLLFLLVVVQAEMLHLDGDYHINDCLSFQAFKGTSGTAEEEESAGSVVLPANCTDHTEN